MLIVDSAIDIHIQTIHILKNKWEMMRKNENSQTSCFVTITNGRLEINQQKI